MCRAARRSAAKASKCQPPKAECNKSATWLCKPFFFLCFDMVLRQIGDALTDPNNEWAEVFRLFCQRYIATERARTASDDRGTRLAAHQLKLTVDLWPDPARGTALADTHPLVRFFEMAQTITVPNPDPTMPNPAYPHDSDYPRIPDPDAPEFVQDPVIAAKVAMMQACLAGTEFDWQLALRRYGMTLPQADALLLTMQPGTEADIAVVEVNAAPATIAQPVAIAE